MTRYVVENVRPRKYSIASTNNKLAKNESPLTNDSRDQPTSSSRSTSLLLRRNSCKRRFALRILLSLSAIKGNERGDLILSANRVCLE